MNEGTMKIGLNLWVWESPFRTDRHLGLLEKAKAMRAEAVEFALEEGSVVESSMLRRALAEQGLGCSIIGMFGTERDLSSPNASVRQKGLDYARKSLETCAEVGAAVFSGACVGAGGSQLVSDTERLTRYKLASERLHEIGEFSAKVGVPFCVEILNRYEDSILNTSAQACELMDITGHPSVGIHLDTFHMNMEERSMGAALRLAGNRLFHLHASESHRGKPGNGAVPWRMVTKALHDIDYKGFAIIESFDPRGRLAPMARAWRPYEESQDVIAKEGLAFLWETLRA
jgi:D-psicose/D-tagatose/L-ribulose 3-epimerase